MGAVRRRRGGGSRIGEEGSRGISRHLVQSPRMSRATALVLDLAGMTFVRDVEMR